VTAMLDMDLGRLEVFFDMKSVAVFEDVSGTVLYPALTMCHGNPMETYTLE
jgi:hypothetical protein